MGFDDVESSFWFQAHLPPATWLFLHRKLFPALSVAIVQESDIQLRVVRLSATKSGIYFVWFVGGLENLFVSEKDQIRRLVIY